MSKLKALVGPFNQDKALVGAFNQEKVLVGAFSVIVKTGCGTDGALHSTSHNSETVADCQVPGCRGPHSTLHTHKNVT